MELEINWVAVVVGTVLHQALGALWYGVVFRDTWVRAMGLRPEDTEREGPGGEMAFSVAAFSSAR